MPVPLFFPPLRPPILGEQIFGSVFEYHIGHIGLTGTVRLYPSWGALVALELADRGRLVWSGLVWTFNTTPPLSAVSPQLARVRNLRHDNIHRHWHSRSSRRACSACRATGRLRQTRILSDRDGGIPRRVRRQPGRSRAAKVCCETASGQQWCGVVGPPVVIMQRPMLGRRAARTHGMRLPVGGSNQRRPWNRRVRGLAVHLTPS